MKIIPKYLCINKHVLASVIYGVLPLVSMVIMSHFPEGQIGAKCAHFQ